MVYDEHSIDIADLEQARRVIADLRRQIEELEATAQPAENERSAFLDEDHAAKLTILFERQMMFEGQDEEMEIDEAFSVFVEDAIDLQWDFVSLDHDWPLKPTSTA